MMGWRLLSVSPLARHHHHDQSTPRSYRRLFAITYVSLANRSIIVVPKPRAFTTTSTDSNLQTTLLAARAATTASLLSQLAHHCSENLMHVHS